MNDPGKTPASDDAAARLQRESERGSQGMIPELCAFVWQNKKWWLIPILAVLVALSVLLVLGATGASPFVYTFF